MYSWNARVEGPTPGEPIASTETWACNCATRRRSDGSTPSGEKFSKPCWTEGCLGLWTLLTIKLGTGKKVRVLTVVDTFSRYAPVLDPRHSYRGEDVVQTSNGHAGKLAIRRRSVSIRGLRSCLATLTFGPTLSPWTSHAPANRRNAFVECPNQHWFLTLADARGKMEDWRRLV